jgi:hypothetical protein
MSSLNERPSLPFNQRNTRELISDAFAILGVPIFVMNSYITMSQNRSHEIVRTLTNWLDLCTSHIGGGVTDSLLMRHRNV